MTSARSSEIFTFRQRLDDQHFLEASRLLIQKEAGLFGGTGESEALKDHEEQAEQLADDYRELEKQVSETLKLSLSPEVCKAALASAVRTIYQEAEQDRHWQQSPQTRPGWRPANWKKLHDESLRNLVLRRMNVPTPTPDDPNKQSPSVQAEITALARQLKDDLLWVVEVVRSCYPPEVDICNFYAGLYHQCLSGRLKELAELDPTDRDCKSILLWVNDYYPGSVSRGAQELQLSSNFPSFGATAVQL